jgi:hypothetical protein
MAYFSAPKKTRPKHHINHAFHHVDTTQKPHPNTRFSQNTPQKRAKKQQIHPLTSGTFFLSQ